MDKRQITNYVNFTALILYIIGRVINMGILCWIGLGIYISVAFLVLVGLSLLGL